MEKEPLFSTEISVEITPDFIKKHEVRYEEPGKLIIHIELKRFGAHYEVTSLTLKKYSLEGKESSSRTERSDLERYYRYPEFLEQFFAAIEKPWRAPVLEALFRKASPSMGSTSSIENLLIFRLWKIVSTDSSLIQQFKESFDGKEPTYELVAKVWDELDQEDKGIFVGKDWKSVTDQIAVVKGFLYIAGIAEEPEEYAENYDKQHFR
jgi:hypothetical protein